VNRCHCARSRFMYEAGGEEAMFSEPTPIHPFRGMTWLTFKDGLIVEGWDLWNLGKLLESLQ
jgi:hypothetical protein